MVEIPFPAYAALVSSFLWAAASVYTFRTVKEVGPVVFNTYRVAIGFVVLWAAALAFGPRAAFNWSGALLLMLSGAIGVFLGDILRYAATIRLGPRRTVVLMATNSPMVIGFGAAFLGEVFSLRTYLGIALILVAVLNMALFDIRSDEDRNRYEVITGIAWTGVIVGLAAAVFQASGILLAKLALTSAFDPLQATGLANQRSIRGGRLLYPGHGPHAGTPEHHGKTDIGRGGQHGRRHGVRYGPSPLRPQARTGRNRRRLSVDGARLHHPDCLGSHEAHAAPGRDRERRRDRVRPRSHFLGIGEVDGSTGPRRDSLEPRRHRALGVETG